MTSQSVLIVDDEPDIRELLDITLSRMGLITHSAATLEEAREMVEPGGAASRVVAGVKRGMASGGQIPRAFRKASCTLRIATSLYAAKNYLSDGRSYRAACGEDGSECRALPAGRGGCPAR